MPHLISFSLLPRAFRADVANTDQLNERATLEDWQVLIGDTAATDDASADGKALRSPTQAMRPARTAAGVFSARRTTRRRACSPRATT